MIDSDKIQEWIEEVEARPSSAPIILQYIANRLRHLTERNEELLAENIALQSGARVDEYERRISHLEYQLDLLKRQLSKPSEIGFDAESEQQTKQVSLLESDSLLIYTRQGRVLRRVLNPEDLTQENSLGDVRGSVNFVTETPRMLAVSNKEDLLFVFTSGRIATRSVIGIPTALPTTNNTGEFDWDRVPVVEEPRVGEELTCLMPLSNLALADYFLQVSRRGYTKRINISMAESILENRYIGVGVKQPGDQTFEISLGNQDDLIILISERGASVCMLASKLPYTIDEAIRLKSDDHLVAALVARPRDTFLAVTQNGKLIHRTANTLEITTSLHTRGQRLFSVQRQNQGTKILNATLIHTKGWAFAYHRDGQISVHVLQELLDTGKLPVHNELIAFATLSTEENAQGQDA